MNGNRIISSCIVAILLAAAAACSSPQSHFYTLAATADSDGQPPASYAVAVGPVSIPAAVDQPQFVVHTGPNDVNVDEFNRWAAPLDDSIANVVAGNLATLLGTPNVVVTPPSSPIPAYQVRLDVQRFEAVYSQFVLVDAVWVVSAPKGKPVRSGRTVAQEAVGVAGYSALAAGYSRALAKVSADIAAAIRAEAAQKR